MPDTPNTTEVEDLIRYDILAQEALRGVVKKVLKEVARTGLPGEHHFYITFDTQYAGVRMSNRMRERYPDEMTIVIQHQFWDLETSDNGFSIGLSFDNIPETMVIPFAAIRGFFDPAVQFGLQFETPDDGDHASADTEEDTVETTAQDARPSSSPVPKVASKADSRKKSAEGREPPPDEPSSEEAGSAEVVSLDAFRRK